MPRIHFLADHDYRHPKFPQTIAYKAGWKGLVSAHVSEEAIGLGKAELVGASKHGAEPGSEASAEPGENSDDDGADGRG
jgi:hypothetical protein